MRRASLPGLQQGVGEQRQAAWFLADIEQGALAQTESEMKAKGATVLAVPTDALTSLYSSVETLRDLPGAQLAQIAHFFEHYKDLETGKWVRVDGWAGPDEAKEEVLAGIERFRTADDKPAF